MRFNPFRFRPSKPEELTDEEIRFFRDHPDEINLVLSREVVQLRLIVRILLLAVFMVAGSKLLQWQYNDVLGQFVNDIVVDLVFETGAALLGGAVTVLFIEILQKRQFDANVRIKKEIKRRVAELNAAEQGAT